MESILFEIIAVIISFISLIITLCEKRANFEKEKADKSRENDKYWFREVVLNRCIDKFDELFLFIDSKIDEISSVELSASFTFTDDISNECVDMLICVKKIVTPIIKATNNEMSKNILKTLNDFEDIFQDYFSKCNGKSSRILKYEASLLKRECEIKKFELIRELYTYSINEKFVDRKDY